MKVRKRKVVTTPVRYQCICTTHCRHAAAGPGHMCLICFWCRKRDGSCTACGTPPTDPLAHRAVDSERLKQLLRDSGVPIDKMIEADKRRLKKELKRAAGR